jgi:hypothetical protein
VVLTRWLGCILCVRVLISDREAHVQYFDWKCTPKAGDPTGTKRAKAVTIRSRITDNASFAWYYFLEDVLPILTSMNILFQEATLPLPHLLYEKVDTAKAQFRGMVGQEPRDNLMLEGDITFETPFGPAVESFFDGCNTGKHKYGANGGTLSRTIVYDLKHKFYLAVSFMLESLHIRFPAADMHVHKLVRCVDPRLRRTPNLDGKTHVYYCVKHLLYYFEVPLFGYVEPSLFWLATQYFSPA